MAITGTGTGPFTVTGTETILSIFNAVVAANAANATRNANNTQFTFLCVVNFGDGTTVTNVNPTELQVEFNGATFAVAANATFQMGTPNPPRAGGYLRINASGNSLNLRGTFHLFASRYFTAAAEPGTTNTGNNVLFDECSLNMVNGYGNANGAFNPTITYRNCQLAGAGSVALKLAGQMTVIAPKVYNSLFAFQPLPAAGATTTYTVSDAVIVGCTNDVVPNSVVPVTTNFVGVFDGTGAPRTDLILAAPSSVSITRLQWRYNLTAFLGQSALSDATVRILSAATNPPSTVFSGTTDANGRIAQQVLTRIEYLGQAVGFSRWPYAVDVRAYDKTSAQLTYNADNHASQVTASTAIPTSLTQGQAAALTGITLTATKTPTTVEAVTNGSFATDTAWTKGVGVTISSGVANATNTSTILTQNIDVVPGLTYQFSMTYNKTAGIALRFSNSLADSTNLVHTTGTLANGTGTITFTFTAVRSGLVIAASGALFSGTIDNVSCTTTYNAVSPNNGALAISTSKSVADIWSFWRNYISTLANFDSADTWTYDGSTLSAGAWTTSITGGTVSAGTLASPAISVVSPAIVSANLTGAVINSGTISGTITGAVVNSGTLSGVVVGNVTNSGTINGARITGNVTQATPINLTGVTITGDLTFNTNTAVTVTLTNTAISGTVSNTGTALVTVVLAGTSTVGTAGANVSVQVQCTVTRFDGGSFNLVARYGTTGSYTDLGYQSGITTTTFTVPIGQPVELAMWSLGFLSFVRTIATTGGGFTLAADMIPEADVDTTLDVSTYLADITISNAGGVFTATFAANLSVPGIEATKGIVHRLLGIENALRALLPPGSATIIEIEPDEIQINQPGVFLVLGAGASNVEIAGFVNTAPAKAINPNYILNPRRVSDNLRVEVPLVKPALDVAAMAAAVRTNLAVELARIDVATSTRSTLTAGDVPAGLTAAQVWSAPARTLTSTSAPTDVQVAGAVRAELATELGRIDASVSSRLPASSYTAPDNAGVAAIKAKTDALPAQPASVGSAMTLTAAYDPAKTAAQATALATLATNSQAEHDATQTAIAALPAAPTLGQIEASTVLAKQSTTEAIKAKTDTITAAPSAAANAQATRAELATELGRIDASVSSRSTLAAGAAMTLTSTYDAAKSAASQASVDALATDLDTLDQLAQDLPTLAEIEASTVLAKKADLPAAPDNAGIAAINSKLPVINRNIRSASFFNYPAFEEL